MSCRLALGLVSLGSLTASRFDLETSPIAADKTIRPFGLEGNICLHKRYSKYKEEQDVWLWDCKDLKHKNVKKNGRYKWRQYGDSNAIESVGSTKVGDKGAMCLWAKKLEGWKQVLKINICNATDPQQQWSFGQGRMFLTQYPEFCIGIEPNYETGVTESSVRVVITKCMHTDFSRINTDGVYDEGFQAGVDSVSGSTTVATTTNASIEKIACGSEALLYNPETEACCVYSDKHYLVAKNSSCLDDLFSTEAPSTTSMTTNTEPTTTPEETSTTTTTTTTTTTEPITCGQGCGTTPEETTFPDTTTVPETGDPDSRTELERYVQDMDDAFAWEIDEEWVPAGNYDFGDVLGFHRVRLTSQRYLNDTLVPRGSIWRHNVAICVGAVTDLNAGDAGMIWITSEKGHNVSDDVWNQNLGSYCNTAKRLGIVAMLIEQIPAAMEYWFKPGDYTGEKHQITGLEAFIHYDVPITAAMEFPEAKAITAAINMVDELTLQKGYRSAPLTKWSVTGGSKRGTASITACAADPRLVACYPVINNVKIDWGAVQKDTIQSLGGYSKSWSGHYDAGWHNFTFGQGDAYDAEKAAALSKSLYFNSGHYKDKLRQMPMHFILGTADSYMPIDGMLSWWDTDWAEYQRTTFNLQVNKGHSGGPSSQMHVQFEAVLRDEVGQLPYVDWSIHDDDTLKICLVRPTAATVAVYRGVSEYGRDFRDSRMTSPGVSPTVEQNKNIFQSVASCSHAGGEDNSMECSDVDVNIAIDSVEGENNCYFVKDNNVNGEGVYSAVIFEIEWATWFKKANNNNYTVIHTSAPLIRPKERPYSHIVCPGEHCLNLQKV